MTKPSFCIIIPTFNAVKNVEGFADNFKNLMACGHDVLVIDSSSTDGTAQLIEKLGSRVITIPQSEFNHGATREFARRESGSDIVVFLTQDVKVVSNNFINKLIEPLIKEKSVVVSYARQLPFDGAGIFEIFPREFNYPEQSQIRSIDDVKQYGIYTFFCSNSCAAYRNEALNRIGGFDSSMNSEDYFAVAKLLSKGYKIAYVAESVVQHSHKYSLVEEFKRYFDVGYVRAQYPEVQKIVGQAESRGKVFAQQLFVRLIKSHQIYLLPYAFIQMAIKWLGYRMGYFGHFLPVVIKKKLSGQAYYWSSKYLS